MTGSTVPAAVAGLVAVFDAALSDTDWTVNDGPIYGVPNTDFLCVAYSGDPEQPGVTVDTAPGDAGLAQDRESYDVECVLTAHAGVNDVAALRAAAYTAFTQLNGALSANRSLTAVVARARITGHELVQAVSETGTSVAIRFTVHVDAWAHNQ